MKPLRRKRLATLVILLAVLGAAATGCGGGDGSVPDESRTVEYALAPGATITVQAHNGRLTVRRSADEKFRVRATLHNPRRVQFYVLPKSSEPIQEVLVSARLVEGPGGDAGSELAIEVPDGSTFRTDTTNGFIDAEGLTVKEANLIATNGPLRLRSSKGNFTASTTEGAVAISGSEGTFWTQTTNASIEFDGTIRTHSPSRFKTTNGDVTVRLAGSPDVRMTLRSGNGVVSADGATTISDVNRVLTARYGDGAGSLEMETMNGNVRVSLAPPP
jgi:hypothetical protein